MAKNNQAPAVFARTTRFGVPYVAVLATWLIGCLAYLNVSNDGATVFTWFMNISTISGFIAWIVILITYLRFRSAMEFNNLLQHLPFRTPLQPYSTWAALFILTILTLTNGFHVFFPDNWSASNFLAAYITLPIFVVLYLGHKIWFRTPLARKILDIDAFTGKREMDELEAMDVPPIAKNWLQKIWFWIA
jgi:amino acid transporter